jgi:peroxiredoxin
MEAVSTPIGHYAPDFELPGIDGSVHHLARYLEKHRAVGVVFMGNHCPYVQQYLERLKRLQAEFQPDGFTLIGINPNDLEQVPTEGFEQMTALAIAADFNFPYLRDVTQDVAQTFGAEKTPHVFVINQAGAICYGGAIDDNADDPQAIQHSYFRDAIRQVLDGQTVTISATKPVGCAIKWRK